MKALPVVLLAAAFVSGCTGVKVYPTGVDVGATPRPSDCPMDFVFKPPAQPYEALADLQSQVTVVPEGGAWLALRAKACALGADAVIVTRTQNLNLFGHVMVEGTAISYRRAIPTPEVAPPTAVPAPAPAPEPASEP